MRRFYGLVGAAALAFGLSSPAAAQLYIEGHGGVVFGENTEIASEDLPALSLDAELDTGYAFGGAVGFDLPLGLRLEGEVTYRKNGVDSVGVGGATVSADADVESVAFMGNGWWEFPAGPVRPYIGGGVGAAQISLSDVGVAGIDIGDEDGWAFAFQAGGGLAFRVAPSIDLTVDYRYFRAVDPKVGDFDAEYSTHNVFAGIRFSL